MMSSAAHIAAIILAAGRSARMMGTNKLLEKFSDESLIRIAVETTIKSGASPIFIVVGHQSERIIAEIADLDVPCVTNPDFAKGLSTSLQAGLRALPKEVDGAIVMLGDMPLVTPTVIQKLMDSFRATPECLAVVPSYREKWGNPVLLARSLFHVASELKGDSGARKLLEMYRDQVVEVIVSDDAVTIDLDTPEAFSAVRNR